MLSSNPVTVRVWAVFHVLGVKVRVGVDNVPSMVSPPVNLMNLMTTLSVG